MKIAILKVPGTSAYPAKGIYRFFSVYGRTPRKMFVIHKRGDEYNIFVVPLYPRFNFMAAGKNHAGSKCEYLAFELRMHPLRVIEIKNHRFLKYKSRKNN